MPERLIRIDLSTDEFKVMQQIQRLDDRARTMGETATAGIHRTGAAADDTAKKTKGLGDILGQTFGASALLNIGRMTTGVMTLGAAMQKVQEIVREGIRQQDEAAAAGRQLMTSRISLGAVTRHPAILAAMSQASKAAFAQGGFGTGAEGLAKAQSFVGRAQLLGFQGLIPQLAPPTMGFLGDREKVLQSLNQLRTVERGAGHAFQPMAEIGRSVVMFREAQAGGTPGDFLDAMAELRPLAERVGLNPASLAATITATAGELGSAGATVPPLKQFFFNLIDKRRTRVTSIEAELAKMATEPPTPKEALKSIEEALDRGEPAGRAARVRAAKTIDSLRRRKFGEQDILGRLASLPEMGPIVEREKTRTRTMGELREYWHLSRPGSARTYLAIARDVERLAELTILFGGPVGQEAVLTAGALGRVPEIRSAWAPTEAENRAYLQNLKDEAAWNEYNASRERRRERTQAAFGREAAIAERGMYDMLRFFGFDKILLETGGPGSPLSYGPLVTPAAPTVVKDVREGVIQGMAAQARPTLGGPSSALDGDWREMVSSQISGY